MPSWFHKGSTQNRKVNSTACASKKNKTFHRKVFGATFHGSTNLFEKCGFKGGDWSSFSRWSTGYAYFSRNQAVAAGNDTFMSRHCKGEDLNIWKTRGGLYSNFCWIGTVRDSARGHLALFSGPLLLSGESPARLTTPRSRRPGVDFTATFSW